MNIKNKLSQYMLGSANTFLGIGPMSVNCVDASIELAKDYNFPLMFIASRRQIDSEELGGGYVNNWNTEQFSKYVLSEKPDAILARDHGGPWQNSREIELELSKTEAIKSAKKSLETDILSGFQVIHIDPSISEVEKLSQNELFEICFELIEHCWSFAKKYCKDICFEIGTEEQTGLVNTIDEFERQIQTINKYCNKSNIDTPLFIVAQTGTRVIETRNIGTFNHPVRVKGEIPPEIQIPKILEICNRNNIFLKQHNTDYLEQKTLEFCPILGINAANVAPEFGVVETMCILRIAKNLDKKIYDEIIELIYSSSKWKKWMAKNSTASKKEKAEIAGHYIFSNDRFKDLKNKLNTHLIKKGKSLDDLLKSDIKLVLKKYLKAFRMI